MKYVEELEKIFREKSNPELSPAMEKYMKDKFKFLGIKTPDRKLIFREFIKKYGYPKRENLNKTVMEIWNLPEREFQYIALEILEKQIKKSELNDIELFEKLIVSKSWWDTVDTISTRLTGEYMKKFPEQIEAYTKKWLKSDNIWLKRMAILFQLKYYKNTNTALLKECVNSCSGTNEFFLNKAIGWALREYAKTNKDWVLDFVENNHLSNLSKREALKHLSKNNFIQG